uniref:Uncharacterized protein n=1 Tax=Ditylum brightwellii TaxID=49249 RepID=A0A7S4QQX3_9STRA
MADTTTNDTTVITVGVDLGTEAIKTVCGSILDYELVRNLHGGHTTPCSISFKNKVRLIGEEATEPKNADVNTILHIARLVLKGNDDNDKSDLEAFYRFNTEKEKDELVVKVDYNGDTKTFTMSALLTMLLGKIHKCVNATIARKLGDNNDTTTTSVQTKYVFALPSTSESVTNAVLDAAYAAGLVGEEGEEVQVVSMAESSAAVYEKKFGKDYDNSDTKGKVVLVVDMGHSQTVVSILRLGGNADNAEDEAKEEKAAPLPATVTILSSIQSNTLGAGNIDIQLWNYFTANNPSLKSSNMKPNSRKGQKLLDGCRKLKHLLSMLPNGSVIVEGLTEDDRDVTLTATREILQSLCKNESERLSALIAKAVEDSSLPPSDDGNAIDAVEILGGGCRVPFIKQTVLDSIGKTSNEMTLSHSLDDTSIALGAAMIGDSASPQNKNGDKEDGEEAKANNTERRQQLLKAEREMSLLDDEMSKLSEARNKIESHILELRSAKHDAKYGSFLPTDGSLDSHLDAVDDWIFTDECDNATLQEMESKLNDVINKSNELCKDYYAAIKKDTEEMERQMVEEEERAKAEKAANGEDEDEEDHDNRRLPKKRRMEIVMKNKNEANELFSDKNYRHAAARYVKALSHCAKFYDLAPEDEEEIKGVKLSLNLNLALAYFKLEKFDNALRSCNDALAIDENSTKALFRRATIYYEKKKWDDAKKDLEKAGKTAPDDKAIQKLQARLEQQIKRQKAKEKKMAQKMFG